MMKTMLVLSGLLLLGGSGAARADRAAADACAAGLDPAGKAIYAASIDAVGSGDLKATVTEKTKGLVMAGAVAMAAARDSALAAGRCLVLAR